MPMQKKHIITIGGLPGSGKSTTKKLLAESLDLRPFSTGDFVRDMAKAQGMTLEEFNEKVFGDKKIDELIDTEQKRINEEDDDYIIDSHLGFYFVPSAFHVYLDISPKVSAERIFDDRDSNIRIRSGDVMQTLEEAERRTQKRIDNHVARYQKHYGINPYDKSLYDLVVNTEMTNPTEVVEKIVQKYKDWLQE